MSFTAALTVVVVLLFLFTALALALIIHKGGFNWQKLGANNLVDSHWISTSSLCIIRYSIFLYCLFILVYSYIFANGTSFRFYTFWNFTLLTLYFLVRKHLLLVFLRRCSTCINLSYNYLT
jgi:hypothetical protein